MAKLSVDREMRRARAMAQKGDRDGARAILGAILEKFPNNARARQAFAKLENSGDRAGAPPPSAQALDELTLLLRDGRAAVAADKADELAAQFPDSAQLWIVIGVANAQLRHLDKAERGFRRACELNRDRADLQVRLGLVLRDRESLDDAIACFSKAAQLDPGYADAYTNLGIVHKMQDNMDAASTAFRRALEINPESFEALNNLGVALKAQGNLKGAIDCYRRALRISPDSFDTLDNLSRALGEREDIAEAVELLERALKIRPDDSKALAQKIRLQLEMCDWRALDEFEKVGNRLGIHVDSASPFQLLAFEDDPARQAQRAQNYAKRRFGQKPLPLPARTRAPQDRIRIGYFSADFHDHPMLFLMSGLLREHDRSRFEIFAYSYGEPRPSAMREQIKEYVDHFIDIWAMPDLQIVELARKHGIDIAIDRKGYTLHSRSQLFAYRLAPIQINYLAYPGTMGADFIDYLVADPVIVPESDRRFYTEEILYLPHCYQPNDNTRPIAETSTTRADFGLPQEGFVFCCFNNNYKIGRREFDIWMNVLRKIEGSVLWLLQSNRWAVDNLRSEARRRGVDPGRLIFAPKMKHAEHLARHKHADLFIDTFNYTAHTTASDALWAGLPVVTRAGRQFSARVGASLLSAVGMPELIAGTETDYEALITDLAANPGQLAEIKAKLAENRLTQPLFDTVRYARDFERALEDIHARHLRDNAAG